MADTIHEDFQKAIRKGIETGVAGLFSNSYGNTYHKKIEELVSQNFDGLRSLMTEAINSCVSDAQFKEEIKASFRQQVAKKLIERFGGEIEKHVNAEKAKAEAEARAEAERIRAEAIKPDISKVHEYAKAIRELKYGQVKSKEAKAALEDASTRLIFIAETLERRTRNSREHPHYNLLLLAGMTLNRNPPWAVAPKSHQ